LGPDPVPDPKEDEKRKPIYAYRAMRNVGGKPEVGDSSLAQLGLRPQDVNNKKPEEIVSPLDMLGMSVTLSRPEDTPFQSPNKPVFRIAISDLPLYGLMVIPKLNDPKSGLVVPILPTKVEDFRSNIHSTRLSWELNK